MEFAEQNGKTVKILREVVLNSTFISLIADQASIGDSIGRVAMVAGKDWRLETTEHGLRTFWNGRFVVDGKFRDICSKELLEVKQIVARRNADAFFPQRRFVSDIQ